MGGGRGRGQGGCERRIEVFVKIQKKKYFLGGGGRWEGSGWWGVRVDVNEIEVFVKIQKKNFFWEGGSWGGGWVGGSWSGWGVRVDVNEELKFL